MLLLLSPAKTLDYDTPFPRALMKQAQPPDFIDRSAELVSVLRRKSAAEIAGLMNLSPVLAELNAERYAAWSRAFSERNSRPALAAFNGDVYEGLQARTLPPAALQWAQQHVVILSGLYGALRPLDLMQPYRLEMGTRLATPRGKDLYAFWGDTLAEYLNERQAGEAAPVIVNLASQEYFKAAHRKALKARVIECVFEDWKGGRYKVISFFAKRARGLMARHAALKRPKTPRALQSFALEGYAFDAAASEDDRWVFRRRVAG
ncbi:MAG: peroxide stress protein YaaA [Pseudomonadota bacterium]